MIKSISRVSKPGRRVYSKIKDFKETLMDLVFIFYQHLKGVLSDNEARSENVGGEILCKIF